jgi:hypothetical protein
VEIWFGRIEREAIARGVLTSVRDLAYNLMTGRVNKRAA